MLSLRSPGGAEPGALELPESEALAAFRAEGTALMSDEIKPSLGGFATRVRTPRLLLSGSTYMVRCALCRRAGTPIQSELRSETREDSLPTVADGELISANPSR